MKNRYIELFLSTPPPRKRPGRPSSIIDDTIASLGVGLSSESSALFSRRGVGGSVSSGPGSTSGYDGYYDAPLRGGNASSGGYRPSGDYRVGSLESDYRLTGELKYSFFRVWIGCLIVCSSL